MGTTRIRLRRSAAQLHALARVEREIRATDPFSRRKYLREFSAAYPRYDAVLRPEELNQELLAADILLVGDYHALPRSQQFAAELVEFLATSGPKGPEYTATRDAGLKACSTQSGSQNSLAKSGSTQSGFTSSFSQRGSQSVRREVVLGLEMIYARDQEIMDEWLRGEIDEHELRQRIRYDVEWGYDWKPIRDLLVRARAAGAKICGVDCMPRGDLRRIGARDRHAAAKLAELHAEHAGAALVVLFGESHLAPKHLPKLLRQLLPASCRVLTVLQNVDALYWQASGELQDRVSAVRVDDDTVCVLNATPLEKYESYRQCLDRWRCDRPGKLDVAPAFYNLIDALLRFLHIDQYATTGATGPRFVVDLLPEVVPVSRAEELRRHLRRKGVAEDEMHRLRERLETDGSCFVAPLNKLYVSRFELRAAADAAAAFVCASGWGEVGTESVRAPSSAPDSARDFARGEDAFYRACLQKALVEYGAHVLFPGRQIARERDLYALYGQSHDEAEKRTRFGYRDYMRMLDFVVLHRDYECNALRYHFVPELIGEGRAWESEKFAFATEWLGRLLGSELYEAYVGGHVGKRTVRSLYLKRMDKEGEAKASYFRLARICRMRRRKPAA